MTRKRWTIIGLIIATTAVTSTIAYFRSRETIQPTEIAEVTPIARPLLPDQTVETPVVTQQTDNTAETIAADSGENNNNLPETTADKNVPHFDSPGCVESTDRGNKGKHDCDNGIWRVRATSQGIMWFDFYHPREEKWYINRNNLDFITISSDGQMSNSELDRVNITTTLVSQSEDSLRIDYGYVYPNGAKVRVELTLNKNDPLLHFKFYTEDGSVKITEFSEVVTFGQGEAVDTVQFAGGTLRASDYPMPLENGSLELQKLLYYSDLSNLEFNFWGPESTERDSNNPAWMQRYLGLKQYIRVEKPMRKIFGDVVGIEVRDVPWQPTWKIPERRPWFEGIWLIRKMKFVEGESLEYGLTNYSDYQ